MADVDLARVADWQRDALRFLSSPRDRLDIDQALRLLSLLAHHGVPALQAEAARLDEVRKTFAAMVKAVRDLHQPFTYVGQRWCEACSPRDVEFRYVLTTWPCPTIVALNETEA